MNTLAARIIDANIRNEDELVVGPEGSITVADVANGKLDFRSLNPISAQSAEATKVAISFRSSLQFVRALALLDGHVGGILIFAPTLSALMVKSLMAEHGGSFLLSDRTDLEGAAPLDAIVDRMGKDPKLNGPRISTAWILTTSGTTGEPKVVQHTLEGLTRSVRGRQHARAKARWGLLYDPSRFAGLQVILQSLLGGGTLIAPDQESSWNSRLAFLRSNQCSHLSATPTLWRKILMSSESIDWPFQQITLGGEIADELVLKSLRQNYSSARITQIYASTEVGFGFSVHDSRPGFPAEFLRKPSYGPELKIIDDVLWIRPADTDLNRPLASHIVQDEEGFIRTGDRVKITEDRVIILGRESSLANIGGIKIQVEDVERIVNSHPEVSACTVGSRPNSIVGSVLTLVIVPNSNVSDLVRLRKEIKLWCKQHLPREAQPAVISFSDQMAVNSSGKILRNDRL